MASAKILFPFILKWEGGLVNDPADAGGATNMGVTMATYEAYCRRKGYPRPTIARLKAITREQVFDIFKTMYWDRWRADDIKNQRVANILVDWLWCSGAYGIKIPQRLIGVASDGVVGQKTIAAVNSADASLFTAIYDARVAFLNDIVNGSIEKYEKRIGRKATENEKIKFTNKRFLKGWMNRLNSIKVI